MERRRRRCVAWDRGIVGAAWTLHLHSPQQLPLRSRQGAAGSPFSSLWVTSRYPGKLGQPCRVWAGEGMVLEGEWVVVQRAGEERTEG